MKINTDLNILGGLPDWNLINLFLADTNLSISTKEEIHNYTSIKTNKSIGRFERAIRSIILKFKNANIEALMRSVLIAEQSTGDSLLLLFCHISFNNDLLDYLNRNVFFSAYYSGRISIKNDEVIACIKDLKESNTDLKEWADSTIKITASKYLTLLKKFNLMDGALHKEIKHQYINDRVFILFIYWLLAIESKANLLESSWMKYCFSEKQVFIERIAQKKFAKFINLYYSGDKLKIEPIIPYSEIYDALTRS